MSPDRTRRCLPFALMLLVAALPCRTSARTRDSLCVISSNIRFDNPKDGDNRWSERKMLLAETLQGEHPDIIATQEGEPQQLHELAGLLEGYRLVNNTQHWKANRHYPTLLVREGAFSILERGDEWLSETPDVPDSRSFGSEYPRLFTWAKVQHLPSQKHLLVINVHLDLHGGNTRQKQAEVLAASIKQLNPEGLPVVLSGDFNEGPGQDVDQTLQERLPRSFDPWKRLGLDEQPTFHRFGRKREGPRLDRFVLQGKLRAERIEIVKTAQWDEHRQALRYPSDHYPVKLQLGLP